MQGQKHRPGLGFRVGLGLRGCGSGLQSRVLGLACQGTAPSPHNPPAPSSGGSVGAKAAPYVGAGAAPGVLFSEMDDEGPDEDEGPMEDTASSPQLAQVTRWARV